MCRNWRAKRDQPAASGSGRLVEERGTSPVGAVVHRHEEGLRRRGRDRAAGFARFGARIGLTEARFGWIEGLFARYGAFTVMFARFFNVLRQLNGIVAGTLGMTWWRFLVCNAVGAALWVLVWMLGAFYLGQHASVLAQAAQHIGVVGGLTAAAAVVAALFALWRWRRASRQAL